MLRWHLKDVTVSCQKLDGGITTPYACWNGLSSLHQKTQQFGGNPQATFVLFSRSSYTLPSA